MNTTPAFIVGPAYIVGPALIIGLLVLFGGGLAGIFYWFKRDVFLASFIACLFAVFGVLVAMAWPEQPIQNDPNYNLQTEQRAAESAEALRAAQQSRAVRRASLDTYDRYRPKELPAQGYVASDACRECHQNNHDSWHASYHRTMTQVATPEAVIGDFDNARVTSKGRDYLLTREGEVCYAEMHDPDLPVSPASRMSVPMVMTTGSHHMQIYWYPIRAPRTLGRMPLAYLKETKQWLPHSAIFLEPPDTPTSTEFGRWNSGCLKCHATHSRQRKLSTGTWDTEVTEFGISCEACHGPGEAHVALHRSGKSDVTADPIVNPAEMDSKASSHVCGQCHGATSSREDMDTVNAHGHGFRPGENLRETHHVWQRDTQVMRDFLSKMDLKQGVDQSLRRMFWDDGNVRVSGREFTGMERSPCYINGKMSCLSCHQLHKDELDSRPLSTWANDQLSTTGLDDQACLQCHTQGDYGPKHTHHSVGSSGSSCYNCHMPHTSYGLLTAMRSHTITSPDVGRDLQARRPGACNLCHLDKTFEWTADHLSQWFGTEKPNLTAEQRDTAASVLWLLKGDAGERALAAWSMGWKDAQAASRSDWIVPLLAKLLMDPYEAVRIITRRSLKSFPQLSETEIDAMASETVRSQLMQSVISSWENFRAADPNDDSAVFMQDGDIDWKNVQRMMGDRDETSVRLME